MSKSPSIPHVSTIPAVAEAESALARVVAEESQVGRELRALREAASKRIDPGASERRALAERLLDTGDVDTADYETAAAKQRRLESRWPILTEAVGLARQRLDAARNRATDSLRGSIAPRHKELVRKIAEAVVSVGRANAAEAALRDEITASGYTSSIVPHSAFAPVGDLADPQSPAVFFLSELVRSGYLDGNEPFLSGTAAQGVR